MGKFKTTNQLGRVSNKKVLISGKTDLQREVK